MLGWTGGYVLVGVLLAPYLRKFGQFTVPDFLGVRYEGNTARICGVIVLFCASFTYIVAQCFGIGIITSRFLDIPFEVAIFVGLLGILVCSMLGGMRAVTWTQVAQYIILIIAYLIPVVWLSTKLFGNPIPELAYGQVLDQIAAARAEARHPQAARRGLRRRQGPVQLGRVQQLLGADAHPDDRHGVAAAHPDALLHHAERQGRAHLGGLEHLLHLPALLHRAGLRGVRQARGLHQRDRPDIAALPAWVQNWSQVGGLLTIKDANGDGILQLTEFIINQDIIVLSMPEIAGLPYVISGLVAAGGLAAALSTADGLLLAIANALSHDVYYKMIDPHASTVRRLVVARLLLVVVAIIAAAVAGTRPAGIIQMVAWAFSLAAAGLFAPLVLGIWWKRTTAAGAIAGMIVGFGVCAFYLVGTRYFDMQLWFGIRNISSALFGLPLAFLVTWAVSLMTQAPSKEMQDFVDSIRVPKGELAWVKGAVHD